MYYAKRSRHQAQALYSSLCLTYLQICTWADYGEAFSSYLCRLQHFQQFWLFLKTSYAAVWSLQDAAEKKTGLVNLVLITALSLPCVLGYNIWSWSGFEIFGGAVLDVEDFLVSNIFLPLGSLVYLLFCVTRYGWGWSNFKTEANTGKGLKMHDWMKPYLTYILPAIVLFIFVFGIYDKFFA